MLGLDRKPPPLAPSVVFLVTVPTLDYNSPTPAPKDPRRIDRAIVVTILVAACDVAAPGLAWLAGHLFNLDPMIAVLGPVVAAIALCVILASGGIAFFFPKEAGARWRTAVWALPAVGLAVSLGVFLVARGGV